MFNREKLSKEIEDSIEDILNNNFDMFTKPKDLFPIIDDAVKRSLYSWIMQRTRNNGLKSSGYLGVNRNTFRKWSLK